jgi:hypothetical protein
MDSEKKTTADNEDGRQVMAISHFDWKRLIWLNVRICMFIEDWKLIYSDLFILKRKVMKNWGGGGGGGWLEVLEPDKNDRHARHGGKQRNLYNCPHYIVQHWKAIRTLNSSYLHICRYSFAPIPISQSVEGTTSIILKVTLSSILTTIIHRDAIFDYVIFVWSFGFIYHCLVHSFIAEKKQT